MGLTNTEICEGPEGPSGWAKPGTLAKRWITVQLPAGERFTRKALDWHGKKGTSLDDSACEQGSCFVDALQPLLSLAAEADALFVMLNKAHEFYAFCRDMQKRDLGLNSRAQHFLQEVRNGKCTAELSKDFDDGYLMRLSAAYQHFVKGPDGTLQAHKASDDARMTGPLFLEIYGWKINNKPNETMEKEVPEDESGAICADPAELSHEDDKIKAKRARHA